MTRLAFRGAPFLTFIFLLTFIAWMGSDNSARASSSESAQEISSPPKQGVGFDGAQWIWHAPGAGESKKSFAAGARFFRVETSIPENPALKSAEIVVTCDNLFVLYLNGRPVGESGADNNAWKSPKRFDLTDRLTPGRVVLAIECYNTLPGPAGLIAQLSVEFEENKTITLLSDAQWRCSASEQANWQQPEFDDQKWAQAISLGKYGVAPWGNVKPPLKAEASGTTIGRVHKAVSNISSQYRAKIEFQEDTPEGFTWPEGIVFIEDDCSLYRPRQKTGKSAEDSLTVTIFNPRKSRSFPEHDLPAPMKVGRKLTRLAPARPDSEPRTLLDAGSGAIGSPSVSFDGKWIYFSMAREGDAFFHIYRIASKGGSPRQLTDGPFFDIDPVELPDGRLVFVSTRIGTFEEYHSSPSRALFVMDADGEDIRALTNTIIFDNEPEILADGRIIFIRSDNFFGRGKVETRLHAIFPDGSRGFTEFGLENGPEYGNRLRSFYTGSPAPMPDGRVAWVSNAGIAIGRPGDPQRATQHYALEAGDVAALPDGRLLCTISQSFSVEIAQGKKTKQVADLGYGKIGILDTRSEPPTLNLIYRSPELALHSPVSLGQRPLPPIRPLQVSEGNGEAKQATGMLYCQDVRFSQNTTAGWPHVRAIRIIAAKGLTLRSSHSYIVHAGNETVELGTVPLAPDGSFYVEVPADTPLAFQAVDAEGRSELNEMSWIYVRPGEQRGCVGCHQPRQSALGLRRTQPMAVRMDPLKMLGQGRPHRFRGNNAAVTGLMELQFDRFREVAGLNRHDDMSASATGEEEVAALIEELRGPDMGLKISAANRLAIFRVPAAAAALAECLDDDSREVRVASAMALATCGTRESATPLLEALDDADPLLSQAALVALENLTGRAEDFGAFTDAAWDEIEEGLILRLQSADRDVVRRAAVAMGRVGGEASRAALRQYVAAERNNNPHPEWRKTHRGDNARFNSLSPVNPRTLQAAVRSLGYLQDAESVPMLAETLEQHSDPRTGNLFLAEAAAEALGRIGTPEAKTALVEAFAALRPFPELTYWYGDHEALMASHASPTHYFIMEALDFEGFEKAQGILPHIIRSVPIDSDRALFFENDDYETLAGRIIRRCGAQADVVETCLAMLGDERAVAKPEIQDALTTTPRCWAGHPTPEIRAAQILSLACADIRYSPRIQVLLERYAAKKTKIKRVFETGIPVVDKLPVKNWVCFYLARTQGNLSDPKAVDSLIALLDGSPAEAASGRPDPLGPGNLFLHNDLTPCWRAGVAWALGQTGDRRAVPTLLKIIGDLDNAIDTRHAAAQALGSLADPGSVRAIRKLLENYPEQSTRLALERAAGQCATGRAN